MAHEAGKGDGIRPGVGYQENHGKIDWSQKLNSAPAAGSKVAAQACTAAEQVGLSAQLRQLANDGTEYLTVNAPKSVLIAVADYIDAAGKSGLVELIERMYKHHCTTSMPLAIENYGGPNGAAEEGRQLWRHDVPAAIRALKGG